jgi:hypothetical protein
MRYKLLVIMCFLASGLNAAEEQKRAAAVAAVVPARRARGAAAAPAGEARVVKKGHPARLTREFPRSVKVQVIFAPCNDPACPAILNCLVSIQENAPIGNLKRQVLHAYTDLRDRTCTMHPDKIYVKRKNSSGTRDAVLSATTLDVLMNNRGFNPDREPLYALYHETCRCAHVAKVAKLNAARKVRFARLPENEEHKA